MVRINSNQTFETSDLALASYLLTRGLRLWATAAHDPGRVVFVLAPRPSDQDLVLFAEARATANVHEFIRAQRSLKREIWRVKDEGR